MNQNAAPTRTETDPFNQALAHHSAGRYAAAVPLYRAVLLLEPDHAEANHLLGMIMFQHGQAETACAFLAKASASAGASPEMHNNFGVALHSGGRHDEAAAAFGRALAARPEYPEALNNLGSVYKDAGRAADAVAAFRRAVALKPDYTVAAQNLRAAYANIVPAWHFAMMNDVARNTAFDAALRRAAPGRRVLDIGTGAGLLAMMAARAGAAGVTSCEQVELIAERARDIIARNGFQDQVRVIGKSSTALAVGRDLPHRAQVLVTETFSSGLIGEGLLPALEHAHRELLEPDATLIPFAASARGYLVSGNSLHDRLFVEQAAGFAVTPFSDFAPAKIGIDLNHEPHQPLSDDVELIRFNLGDRQFPAGAHSIAVTAIAEGSCVGVAQWLKLEMDADTAYENRPVQHTVRPPVGETWAHIVYRFPQPVNVRPGDVLTLTIRHDRRDLAVDFTGISRRA